MNKHQQILLLIFSCAMYFWSCGERVIDRINQEAASIIALKEQRKLSQDSSDNEWKIVRDKAIGVSNMRGQSVNNVEIRISEECTNRTGTYVVISNEKSQWFSKVFYYSYKSRNHMMVDSIVLDSSKKVVLVKSGWDAFLKKILDLGVMRLPDYRTLNNFLPSTDEQIVTVEIRAKEFYRYYEYLSPRHWSPNFPEAKAMVKILNLTAEELRVNTCAK